VTVMFSLNGFCNFSDVGIWFRCKIEGKYSIDDVTSDGVSGKKSGSVGSNDGMRSATRAGCRTSNGVLFLDPPMTI
jgi:hypothetical protein